jgi:hypothetical protein
MTKRAEELKIKGAAVVAYIQGETTKSWSSKMVVVGAMKDAPTEKNHGANLLAIAYSKAAEMGETLKDSGNAGRPPMTGENGWQGGLIKKGKTGYDMLRVTVLVGDGKRKALFAAAAFTSPPTTGPSAEASSRHGSSPHPIRWRQLYE